MAKDLVKDFFKRDLSDAELDALQKRLASSEEALRFSSEAERFHRSLGAAVVAALALKLAKVGKGGSLWSGAGVSAAGKALALKTVLVVAGAGVVSVGAVQAYKTYTKPVPLPVVETVTAPPAPVPAPVAPKHGNQVALKLDLQVAARVSAMVLDEQKNLIRDLGTQAMDAGPHRLVWDGYTDDGQVPAPGRYQVVVRWNGKEAGKWVELRSAH